MFLEKGLRQEFEADCEAAEEKAQRCAEKVEEAECLKKEKKCWMKEQLKWKKDWAVETMPEILLAFSHGFGEMWHSDMISAFLTDHPW